MAKTKAKPKVEAKDDDLVFKGRPTIFNDQIAEKICQGIMSKSSLREVCSQDDMPDRSTVFVWLASTNPMYKDFQDRYARAYQIKLDCLADDIIAISDDKTKDKYVDSEGKERTDNEAVRRSVLRVDSRKWILAKLKPKKYGDRAGEDDAKKNDVADALQTVSNFIKGMPN